MLSHWIASSEGVYVYQDSTETYNEATVRIVINSEATDVSKSSYANVNSSHIADVNGRPRLENWTSQPDQSLGGKGLDR